jgi:plasmid stabilization system protein ParE
MRVVTHPKANQELKEATLYYDHNSPGLGDDFLNEFSATLSRIVASPARWPVILGTARQLKLNRFPYAVIYETLPEEIVVIAVMHLRRQPFYWFNRLQ